MRRHTTEELLNAAQAHLERLRAEAAALDEKMSWMFDMLMSAAKSVAKEAEAAEKRKATLKDDFDHRMHEFECNMCDVAMAYTKARKKAVSAWRKAEKAEKEMNKLATQYHQEQDALRRQAA